MDGGRERVEATLNSLGMGERANGIASHHFHLPPDEDGVEVEVHHINRHIVGGGVGLRQVTLPNIKQDNEMRIKPGFFSVESLAEALCQEYDITPEDAMSDVAELTAQWQQVGVVE